MIVDVVSQKRTVQYKLPLSYSTTHHGIQEAIDSRLYVHVVRHGQISDDHLMSFTCFSGGDPALQRPRPIGELARLALSYNCYENSICDIERYGRRRSGLSQLGGHR